MDRKIKIGHLIYSNQIGGSEMVAANICSSLKKNNYDPIVVIFYKSHGAMPEVLKEMRLKYINIEMTRWKRIFGPITIYFTLKKLNLDILHVHHVPLYERVKYGVALTGIENVVVTEHAKYSISRSKKLQKKCKNAVKKFKYFVTVSNELKKFFVDIGINEQHVKVIHNGVDTQKFVKKTTEERLSKDHNELNGTANIVSVGRLTDAKDHYNLLRASKVLKDENVKHKIVLVGDGELKENINRLIEKLYINNSVKLIGTQTDVLRILKKADLFVLHSKREGLPVALLEAMSCGLPVVTTKVGAIPEIIKNGVNGIIVEPENSVALADGIKFLLSDKKLADRLSKNARKTIVDSFSIQIMTQKYSNLYEDMYRIK